VVTTLVDITQRKQLELRQAMQHNVTRLLSQAETLEEFIPQVLRTICDALGCVYGGCWLRDRENQMVTRVSSWNAASAEIAEFAASSGQAMPLPLAPGELIRRAWEGGEPVWIGDCVQDPGFKRAPLAAKAGLHGAFAFSIRSQNEVLGVMEFFSRDSVVPDEALVQITRSIGSQVGQFLARKQAELRVRHLANFDDLTGLPNRSMFHQRFSHALAQARRNARNLTILFIDLDRFKNINDTLGHAAGDRVLKVIAERLRGCLRESDTVGRLGGDEFVVLMEDPSQPAQVGLVAQKIIKAVAEPIALDSREVHITASVGISTYPADGADVESLMKNADIAMYRAKDQGKNTYQFYSAQMNIHTVERLAMESDLRRALEREEFLLHYQPRIAIDSTRIAAVEALLRWQQPAKALVPPAQFIPLAEETGLIVPIGEWALKTACALNKSWQDRGLPRLRMAVNLSARQFAQKGLVQTVARVLGETGLPAAALEFEITESMVMVNAQEAAAVLKRLKDMGAYISIDDFGTGYSSLGYLKRFPIDSVKIDKSFVQDLPGDEDDAAITSAIIAMAHHLKIKTVAEGVETEAQLRFLRELGCDEMQGYLFSRPLPQDEILRLLQEASVAGAKPFPGVAALRPKSRRG
jgi:diguanylate cyclase (GGDEF)-like protein